MKKMPYYSAKLGIWLGQWDILLDGKAFLSQGSVFGTPFSDSRGIRTAGECRGISGFHANSRLAHSGVELWNHFPVSAFVGADTPNPTFLAEFSEIPLYALATDADRFSQLLLGYMRITD